MERFEAFCDYLRWFLSRWGVACFSVLVLLLAVVTFAPGADRDLFARVAIGRLIESRGIYLFDPFSFTPQKPIFVDHEWFSGIVFYWLSQIGGDKALALFSIGMLFLSLVLVFAASKAYNSIDRVSFFWMFISLLHCVPLWTSVVRSQVFSYLFIPMVFWAIARLEKKGEALLLLFLPPAMLIWGNSHGGFIVGFAFLGLYLLFLIGCRFRAKATLVFLSLLGCLFSTFINPYGLVNFWSFVIEAVTKARPTIGEWSAILPNDAVGIVTYLYLLIMAIGILLEFKKGRRDFLAVIFLCVAAIEGLRHTRLFPIAGMAGAVFGVQYCNAFCDWVCESKSHLLLLMARSAAFVFMGITIVSLGLVLLFFVNFPHFHLSLKGYPVSAVEWLRTEGKGGRLLVDFNNGSFVLWRLYPKYLISLDGRYEEVYPDSTVELVSKAMNPKSPDFRESLAKVNPDYILLQLNEGEADSLQAFGSDWKRVFGAEGFVVLAKGSSSAERKIDSRIVELWRAGF